MDALAQIDGWPAGDAAAGVIDRNGVVGRQGEKERSFDWASVTKLVTSLAVLVAAEEGSIDLDEAAGPPGATVRHLFAHASGLPFEAGKALVQPGRRRIYSNAGFETLADHVALRVEMPFADY
ncbi:MAG: serine hydrolase, partial [Gaiellaceae bacterium]